MNMKSILLASAAAFIATSSAYAADAIVYQEPAPVLVDTYSWTGGYIGLNAGYAGGKAKTTLSALDESNSLSHNGSGFIGGIQAGYNWQFDRTVFGIETDFQGSGVEAKLRLEGETAVKNKIDWFGTTRARIGYTPVDRFMVYATAGVAYGKIKTKFADEFSGSKTKAGFTVGAGAEYALDNNWSLKTEYLYTDLGKAKFNRSIEDETVRVKTKFDFHTVRVGLNYKF